MTTTNTTPPAEDRRERDRGPLAPAWNFLFGAIRLLAGHARTFYTALGIFLVIGAALAVAATIGFAKLAQHVLAGGTQAFDVSILQWLHAHHRPLLTKFMIELTYLGTGTVVLTVVTVTGLFLWNTEHKHSARLLIAATVGNIILNNALKLIYHRPRPDVFEWQTQAMSSSFPSGHAMSSTVVYGTVAYLLMRLQKHHWSRVLTLCGAITLILCICLTRLYLGVHYPSDIIGGIIVGLAWAAFCMATLEASLALARRRAPKDVVSEAPAPKEIAAPQAS